MTVAELIELLKTYPQDLLVVQQMYSEQYIITPDCFTIKTLCKPRPDGWVQNYRADKESQEYLGIAGN